MVDIAKGVLEDSLKQLNLNDMSGGLVTSIGPLAIGPNQTPDSLNVFAYQGQLLFRGGYTLFSHLASTADGAFTYIDAGGTQHLMIWSNGSLYDCKTASPVLVASSVYTPGQQIAHCVLNGVMYWATLTVPLRQYNGTIEKAVANSGGAGVVPPPACNFLVPYAGSLIAVYPVPSGVPEPSAFMWSDVNDPTTWFGSSIQTVGSNDGSICTFALLMGIIPGGVATTGVPSTRQLIVGKNKENLFLYQGALGTLTENAIPTPVGAIDANSAVYIPTEQGLGAVMFLGSDGQMYLTNGSTAIVASANIKNLVYTLTTNALLINPTQKFNATYNAQYQYYMVDFGQNTQLVYKWDTQAWWLFQGWPSGPYMTAYGTSGLPSVFVAAASPGVTGLYQIGLPQTNDNGSNITAYYTTPYLHGGRPEQAKIYDSTTIFAYNVGIQYAVTGTSIPRNDNTQQTTKALIMNDPAYGAVAATGSGATWDQSQWDNSVWGGGSPTTAQPYPMVAMSGRFTVVSTGSKWIPAGDTSPFRAGAAQIKIAWSGGIPDFRLVGLNVSMMFRSRGQVGNLPYTTEGNYTGGNDKYTNVGIDP